MEEDILAFRPVLEQMNSFGARLSQLSSKEGGKTLEEMSSRISRRFDAVCEQFQRRAERLAMSRQRSSEVRRDGYEMEFCSLTKLYCVVGGRRYGQSYRSASRRRKVYGQRRRRVE